MGEPRSAAGAAVVITFLPRRQRGRHRMREIMCNHCGRVVRLRKLTGRLVWHSDWTDSVVWHCPGSGERP